MACLRGLKENDGPVACWVEPFPALAALPHPGADVANWPKEETEPVAAPFPHGSEGGDAADDEPNALVGLASRTGADRPTKRLGRAAIGAAVPAPKPVIWPNPAPKLPATPAPPSAPALPPPVLAIGLNCNRLFFPAPHTGTGADPASGESCAV